jgi:hypothetical protein
MKRLVVGIKGPTSILRAESDDLEDAEANRQLEEVARARKEGTTHQPLVKLPWLWVRASDVLFARTSPPSGRPQP